MIEIDGSQGEGGGQMLRTALSLSCITGKAFRITNIRKNRSKPGLMRQHLVAVQSAARISAAEVTGDQLGSVQLTFSPSSVTSGNYHFDIGTAGSTPLVLQTIIPPLLHGTGTSRLALTGGTHVPFSPSWNYLAEVFAPTLSRIGIHLDLALDSCGFYPKGGGKVRCQVEPAGKISPLAAEQRGRLRRIYGCSAVGNLPLSIAERQAHAARARLEEALGRDVPIVIETREVAVFGQGTFIFLKCEYESALAGFTANGARGKPAERVGEEVAYDLINHDATGMPIDQRLADQLILYLAQAAGPSVFSTARISNHLQTNLMIAGLFIDMDVQVKGEFDAPGTVTIAPRQTASLARL